MISSDKMESRNLQLYLMIIISAPVKVTNKTCSDIPPGLEQNSMGDTVGFNFKNVSINMFVLAALLLIA